MMHGTLDIRKNSNVGSTVEVYQVRYEDPIGNSFVGSMNREDLRELLYHKLTMDMPNDELDLEYQRLLAEGHITFPEIVMQENELAGSGLRYLPSQG